MSHSLSRVSRAEPVQRQPAYPIEPLFLQRWSPRAFEPRSMPLADLHTILEAGRWAPSAHNIQPWHFLYSRRDGQNWQVFLDLLHPFNAGWARQASVLLFLVSQAWAPASDSGPSQPSRTHSFDAGAAWAQLALQATALGYQAHAMAGIDFDKAPQVLNIPATHQLEIAVAIGIRTEVSHLPKALQERERPSTRRPLTEMMTAGPFAPVPGTSP